MENLKKRAKALSRSKEILKYEDVALEADGSFEFGFIEDQFRKFMEEEL